MAKNEVHLEMYPGFYSRFENSYNNAQKVIDNEVLRGCEPYIPLVTGNLIRSGINGTTVGSGIVQWLANYAKDVYYRASGVGRSTGKLRGNYWFERWKKDHLRELMSGVRRKFR